MPRFHTVTGPAYWASYFVNGDASGLTPDERRMADQWLTREGVRIVGAVDDAESRFTNSYQLYDPASVYTSGDVLDYVAEPRESITPATIRADVEGC
jgi:hypothetical protein